MHAAILSIGDELALGQNIDTNSPWLAAQLAQRSILTVEQRTIADDRAAIARAVADLTNRVELLLTTGGLGPTDDDLTREALNDVVAPGDDMTIDQGALAQITQRFQRRGQTMPEMNRKQALRPASMQCLPNPHGTAPGLAGTINKCRVFSMPGPPAEMQPMFFNHVLPALNAVAGGQVMLTAAVHQLGMGESDAAQRLGSLMDRTRRPLVGITVSGSLVSARIRSNGLLERAQQDLEDTVALIERAWHPYAYGRDGQTLAESVGTLLRRANRTLATAESCTGGWLGKMIVDVAGSSDYYAGGWITYTNAMKQAHLHVPASLIDSFGAVSEPVARAMAEGAVAASGADEGLSITGVAGPARTDQPTEKPVGTVFISLARKQHGEVRTNTRHFVFPGDRIAVRDRSAKAALQMMRLALLDVPPDLPLLWEAPATTATEV